MLDIKESKLYNFLGYIAVVVVSLIYVVWGLATMEPSGKTVIEIIAEATLTLTLGILIKNILKQQGVISGESSEKYQETLKLYGKTLENSVSIFSRLNEFTDHKNKLAYKAVRNNLLSRVGLVYSDYFDENDKYIGEHINKPTKHSSNIDVALYKCLNLDITILTPDNLTSDVENETFDPNNLGRTKREWFVEGSIQQWVMLIITAVISGYYTLKYVTEVDWGSMIWKLIQVSIFVLTGLWQLMKAYQFITGPYRNRIIKKSNLLEEAQIWCKNH